MYTYYMAELIFIASHNKITYNIMHTIQQNEPKCNFNSIRKII